MGWYGVDACNACSPRCISTAIAAMFLPQRFQLDRLHEYAPNATFILNTRPADAWVHSVTHWFGLGGRFLTKFQYFQNYQSTVPRNEFLKQLFQNHTHFVRQFVKEHPSHALVEVDISSPTAGHVLADAFGIQSSCWGQHNPNKKRNSKR